MRATISSHRSRAVAVAAKFSSDITPATWSKHFSSICSRAARPGSPECVSCNPEGDWRSIDHVRPLLGTTRDEIDAYLKERRLKYRDDATNETLAPLRNRIRHRVIPYIEKQLGRNVRGALWRAATISADEAEWAETLVDSPSASKSELSLSELRRQPRALQRRTIHLWLQTRGIANLDFETIERVRALVQPAARAAKTNLPHNRHARRRAGKLFLE